ncbi:PREDICTED: gustatory receptor 68a-like [Polistes canadensis]|uniref:gustatory receptor 68a-like n=1 Tax=Polistes canadensis TaxID=91411 RepID=UPI000718DCF1|nr:PREDICTED: gustatory receptor 68a-like [Polistes canadensis]
MDKKSSSKTLKDILRPYHVLTTIFGLRVLKLPSGKTWKYVSSKNRLLNLSNTEYNLMCTLSVIIVIIAMVVGLCKNQQWESSMRSLEEIDKTLQLLGSNSRFHKIYIRTMIEFIFFMTYFFILMCLDVYITNESLDNSNIDKLPTLFFVGFNIYGETVANTVVLEFLTIVRCIKSELERANDLLSDINILPCSSIALELIKYKGKENSLKNLINVLPSSRRKNSRTDVNEQILIRSRQLLQTIRQIHLELYKVSKNTSNLYNIQTSIVIKFASIPHFVISTIFKLIFLNYTCDETTQKMEQVNEIIYTFYGESTDNMIQQEIRVFMFQLIRNRLTFTACGFFDLDHTFLYSVIGSITTYLVILIQVGD